MTDFVEVKIEQAPDMGDEYVIRAREILKGTNYLNGTADYCLAGYLRIKDALTLLKTEL